MTEEAKKSIDVRIAKIKERPGAHDKAYHKAVKEVECPEIRDDVLNFQERSAPDYLVKDETSEGVVHRKQDVHRRE